jgi:hypothetical protein
VATGHVGGWRTAGDQQGVFRITYANESTKDWLIRTVSRLEKLWEGAELTVVDSKELPNRPKLLVRILDTTEAKRVITSLRKQNPVLITSDWLVMSRKVTKKEQALAFSFDLDSHKALAKTNFKTFWGLSRIFFRTLKEDKKLQEDRPV